MAARHPITSHKLFLASAALALMAASPALAQTATWTGATHMAWGTPTN